MSIVRKITDWIKLWRFRQIERRMNLQIQTERRKNWLRRNE